MLTAQNIAVENTNTRGAVLVKFSWPVLPHTTPSFVMSSSQEARQGRKMQLERQMIGMSEDKKVQLRRHLEHEEMLVQKESRNHHGRL